MSISEIFQEIQSASGNEKQRILKLEHGNETFRDAIKATYEPHWVYRVNNFKLDDIEHVEDDNPTSWEGFLNVLYRCRDGELSGNAARDEISNAIGRAPQHDMDWMVRVVNRHLNIGCGVKTFNKVWKGLISTFDCQLANKFKPEKIEGCTYVGVEPKLDGIRCLAFVDLDGVRIFTRGGKHIRNFDLTVGRELLDVVQDNACGPCVFDGEMMSDDFSAMMRQVFRKENIDVTNAVFNIFDWMPLDEWHARRPSMTMQESREKLETLGINISCKYVKLIERRIIKPSDILDAHQGYVSMGIEGTMIKRLDSKYTWKRSWDVMKLKDFETVDLPIVGFNEGTGSYKGRLGSFIVRHGNVSVKVERGHMTRDDALEIWENRSNYRGKIIEVSYQEETRDGSLRFPKFVRFRHDRT